MDRFVLWSQRHVKCCHLNFNVSSWIIGGKKNIEFAIHLVFYLAVFSVVTQRFSPSGGTLRDDNKSGCVLDYHTFGLHRVS